MWAAPKQWPLLHRKFQPASMRRSYRPRKNLEQFPLQLERVVAQLPPKDRAELSTALSFFSFWVAADLAEKKPKEFDAAGESDLAAKSLTHLYGFARSQGASMTLRKYILLSEEMRLRKPELWAAFAKANDSEPSR